VRLDTAELSAWLARARAGMSAPPAFRLLRWQDRHGLFSSADAAALARLGEYRPLPEADPGCFEFVLPAQSSWAISSGDLYRALVQLLGETRNYEWIDYETEESMVMAELVSSVSFDADDGVAQRVSRQLPVIGPGGRAIVYSEPDSYLGRVTMRLVGGRVPGATSWRRDDEILDALIEMVDRAYDVEPSFGYFELSWLDRQEVLRPAFLFAIENRPDEDGPLWRTEVVLPATDIDGLGDDDGLEGWTEL
jgi:hypothetical protein